MSTKPSPAAQPEQPTATAMAPASKRATSSRTPKPATTTPKKTSGGIVKAITDAGEPLDLSAVKKTHVLRVGLRGRKGHWVGKLVNAEPTEQRLTMQVTWMKEPRTVSFADVATVEARTADKASKFAPVRLDA
jgi:hypothetical protein